MAVFVAALVGAVGFFLVLPAVAVMLVAAGVRGRISPQGDERGHRLATVAVRMRWRRGTGFWSVHRVAGPMLAARIFIFQYLPP